MNKIISSIRISFVLTSVLWMTGCSGNKPDATWGLGSVTELYRAAPAGVQTRWISPENPTGEPGKGGMTNKGAKGNAFFVVQPGETQILLDVKGAGIINRMWMSGTIGVNRVQRRAVHIDMYWDGARKPAVSAPIGDFFGIGLGLEARFENVFFSNPEARSFNFSIPMPFRTAALITITNESPEEVWIWYDINYLKLKKLPPDAMYFHAFWNRDPKTTLGEDYVILPMVEGKGRYLGTNVGVIGDSLYRGTWFGEGEVKIFLDDDNEHPTLVGTGTEDYIGTGWGQGEFVARYFGSLVSDEKNDLYAFYRYHIHDPVYFHQNCKVTIQQIGNSTKPDILKLNEKGAGITPIWFLGNQDGKTVQRRLLDEANPPRIEDDDFPTISTNFYRSDDVSATAYFYLDRPENKLPELPPLEIRMKNLEELVFSKIQN